jgi:Common central domain of tyrosinase
LTLVLTVSAGQDVSATRGVYGESRSCVPSGGYCGSTRSNGSQCCEYDQTCQFDGKYLHICRGKSPHDTVTATTTTTPTEIAKAPPSSTREASCVRSGDACNRNSRCCDYWQECRKSGPHLYVCKGDSGPHSDSTARTLASVARHVRRTSSSRTRTKATVMARRPPSNLLTATATANTTATRTGRASASPTSGRPSVCGGLGVITRKDIKQMTQQEWDDYVDAHRRLRATNSNVVLNGFTLNLYEAFSHVHVRDALHRQALFGLWHRLMLWEWDKALNRVKPGVVQPYFDWSVSASDLFADPMFDDDRFGGKGGTGGGSGSPIPTTSLFAGMVSLIDEHNPNPTSRHLVRQNYDSGLTLRGRSYFDGLVTTELGFGKFRIALELAHNTFHRSIGGDMVVRSRLHGPHCLLR